jgi:hypothetical protein
MRSSTSDPTGGVKSTLGRVSRHGEGSASLRLSEAIAELVLSPHIL